MLGERSVSLRCHKNNTTEWVVEPEVRGQEAKTKVQSGQEESRRVDYVLVAMTQLRLFTQVPCPLLGVTHGQA